VEAVSLHDPDLAKRFPALSREELRKALHLITPSGRVYAGFEAAVRVVAMGRFPGKLAFLYYLPGLHWLLDRAYSWLAARRYRLSPPKEH
jgi:predicted DCC family thiol-disulfide oxidoreductase YuxK